MEQGGRNHPLYQAHREWARETIAVDPEEARALARELGGDLAREDLGEHVAPVIQTLRQALFDELTEQGLFSE